jgi:hypothetical protein
MQMARPAHGDRPPRVLHRAVVDRHIRRVGVIDEWHVDERKLLSCRGLSRFRGWLPRPSVQLMIGLSFRDPLNSQSSVERDISPLFSERPPGGHRKRFDSKTLRLFYVPFVGSTEASGESLCGPMLFCTNVTLDS